MRRRWITGLKREENFHTPGFQGKKEVTEINQIILF
jgi:hypothetical protein